MSLFNIVMPKMGESIQEATITNWFVKVGDTVEEDDVLLEIATDKVDSEVPSPVDGKVIDVKYSVDDVVPVGEVIAVIDLSGEGAVVEETPKAEATPEPQKSEEKQPEAEGTSVSVGREESDGRFYSPLVRKIAEENGLSSDDLGAIEGSGLNGRVNKTDIQDFIASKGSESAPAAVKAEKAEPAAKAAPSIPVSIGAEDTIIEMDRVRKIIASHMVNAKHTAPHVTSMVEVDMSNLVSYRSKNKDAFLKKYGTKLTFMPFFTWAAAKALRDFPMVNVSVDGDRIIVKKDVNIGIAVSLPTGNLVVPVVKQADQKNVAGLASSINDIADKARNNKLSGDDVSGGTFSITNFGSFKNVIGTPIINVPEVAILATGNIEKKPAVVETPQGDFIGIRHKMFLSLSYDHRVVDGMLGGSFLRKIADYLEQMDPDQVI